LIDKDETYLSAQQSAAKTDPRIPRPDGVARGTPCAQATAQQGASPTDGFDSVQAARVNRKPDFGFGIEHRLRRRTDFLRVRRLGILSQTAHFVIYLANLPEQKGPRLGSAVSRHIGNAVVRNRTKRRLRESFRCELKSLLRPESAVVIVARKGASELKTQDVTAEVEAVLSRMARRLEASLGTDR
jgi:ribonuclease P protein component